MMDIAYLREWVGRSETVEERLGLALAQRYAATFDLPLPAHEGSVVPALCHWALSPAAVPTAMLDRDGHPKRGGFLPPVPLPRRMWAGGELTFHADMSVGATVCRRSTVSDVTSKEGRSGLLCFVTVTHEVFADDIPVVTERQDIVYRGDESGATPPGRPDGPDLSDPFLVRVVTPTPALLMRYSALTFNAHRIHYDLPYAKDVEGYPGLVVHGPLQASLLLQQAVNAGGTPPRHFRFRSRSPVFCDTDFGLHQAEDHGGLRLWSSQSPGVIGMEAWAAW